METITLTGRDSKLSRIQIELVKARIEAACPSTTVLVKTSSSLGDRLQHIPLQTVEGSDFFTEDIFQNLYTGEADIAVHSLKDMSATHFFGGNHFAVVDRDNVRDLVIFNHNIIEKIRGGAVVVIGTCSPRRELMATRFLKQALPQLGSEVQIETKAIRGNVDTRLKKLEAGEYDGIILAIAGLNRLLRHPEYAELVRPLLRDKKIMVLPLIECTPAPCQGAIVAEAIPQNKRAVNLLNLINQTEPHQHCVQEKKIALKYGAGCDQKFGVTTIAYANQESVFAAGVNEQEREFEDWHGLPEFDTTEKIIWRSKSTTVAEQIDIDETALHTVVFIANKKAVIPGFVEKLNHKRIWAAGSKTWLKLAKKGIWVEGCADGLGLESLLTTWDSPLINIQKSAVTILTHQRAAIGWQHKKWDALATYRVQPSEYNSDEIQSADILFWSSANPFKLIKHLVKPDAIHICASGETHSQLKQAGLSPIVFPTIQSFHSWTNSNIHSPIAG
jgi:hydroxymethylbilane synthase